MKGDWTAYYDYTVAGEYIFPTRPRADFSFKINKDRKLEIEFDPTDNIIFSDVDQNVSQISLRHVESNKFTLMYFYSNKRTLRESVKSHLEPEYANQQNFGEVDIEVFGKLEFEEPSATDFITYMSGEWYDLNGHMRELGVLLKETAKAKMNNTTFMTKLSMLMENHSVTAKMGDIEFKRRDGGRRRLEIA